MEGGHFWTVTYSLVITGIWKGRGGVGSPFSGCVKSETGKKKAKRQNRWRSITCPARCNGGQKRRQSGRFWQPLSQDVALSCKILRDLAVYFIKFGNLLLKFSLYKCAHFP